MRKLKLPCDSTLRRICMLLQQLHPNTPLHTEDYIIKYIKKRWNDGN